MAFTATVRNGEAEFWMPEEHEFLTKQVYDACDKYDAGTADDKATSEAPAGLDRKGTGPDGGVPGPRRGASRRRAQP